MKKRKKNIYKNRILKMREPVTKLQWRTKREGNQKMIESDKKKRKKKRGKDIV